MWMIIFAYAILYFRLSFHRRHRSNKDDDESESIKDTKAHLDNACVCTSKVLLVAKVYDLVLLPSWAYDMSSLVVNISYLYSCCFVFILRSESSVTFHINSRMAGWPNTGKRAATRPVVSSVLGFACAQVLHIINHRALIDLYVVLITHHASTCSAAAIMSLLWPWLSI